MTVGSQCQPSVIYWDGGGGMVPARCHLLGPWWGHSDVSSQADGKADWGLGGSTPVEGRTTEGPDEAEGEAGWGLIGLTPTEEKMTEGHLKLTGRPAWPHGADLRGKKDD